MPKERKKKKKLQRSPLKKGFTRRRKISPDFFQHRIFRHKNNFFIDFVTQLFFLIKKKAKV